MLDAQKYVPRDFFMLVTNIIYFLVYEFAACLLFEE